MVMTFPWRSKIPLFNDSLSQKIKENNEFDPSAVALNDDECLKQNMLRKYDSSIRDFLIAF